MACEYCETSGYWVDDDLEYGDGTTIEFKDGSIVAVGYYDGGYCCGVATIDINFCPMCGERLGDAE